VYVAQLFLGQSFFLVALSSSFIAHAVGSVIWLYSLSMPAEKWIALIPIVAVERFIFAAGSFLVHMGLKRIVDTAQSRPVTLKKASI